MKPSMASDIWSDSDVSLMGTFLYYIDEDWENLHAMLIGCTGFTGEQHTGENIFFFALWLPAIRVGPPELAILAKTFESKP